MPARSVARMMRVLCSDGTGAFSNPNSLGRNPIARETWPIVVEESFPAVCSSMLLASSSDASTCGN